MQENDMAVLPKPELIEKFLVRDFSQFDIVEGDDQDTIDAKTQDLQKAEDFFDFYVDKMVATVAGKKVWHPYVRHHECLSTSKFASKHPRVTAGTEAFVALLYRNAYKKWEKMHAWDKSARGLYPKYNKLKPKENSEWATEYTDACGGVQKFGGWNVAARKKHVQLMKMVTASRENNARRHRIVEQACVKRLQHKYRALYENKKARGKKRNNEENEEEDEELMECFEEDEEIDDEEEGGNDDNEE